MSEAGTLPRGSLLPPRRDRSVRIPPLRERREDIAPLAASFLAREAEAPGERPAIDPAGARAARATTHWPGNVRELAQRGRARRGDRRRGTIAPRDLPERIRARAAQPEAAPPPASAPGAPAYAGSLKDRIEGFERDTLVAVLRQVNGSQTEAARLLDLPLRTMQHKVKRYGLKKLRWRRRRVSALGSADGQELCREAGRVLRPLAGALRERT